LIKLYPESKMADSIRIMAARITGEEVKRSGEKSLWNTLFG